MQEKGIHKACDLDIIENIMVYRCSSLRSHYARSMALRCATQTRYSLQIILQTSNACIHDHLKLIVLFQTGTVQISLVDENNAILDAVYFARIVHKA